MRYGAILGIFVAWAYCLPETALAVELNVQRNWSSEVRANALVAVTNNDEPAGYRGVTVKCTWTAGGRAVAQGIGVTKDLGYGQTDVVQPTARLNGATTDGVTCAVKKAYRNK